MDKSFQQFMRTKDYCRKILQQFPNSSANQLRQHFNAVHKHHVNTALQSLVIEEKVRCSTNASDETLYNNSAE